MPLIYLEYLFISFFLCRVCVRDFFSFFHAYNQLSQNHLLRSPLLSLMISDVTFVTYEHFIYTWVFFGLALNDLQNTSSKPFCFFFFFLLSLHVPSTQLDSLLCLSFLHLVHYITYTSHMLPCLLF